MRKTSIFLIVLIFTVFAFFFGTGLALAKGNTNTMGAAQDLAQALADNPAFSNETFADFFQGKADLPPVIGPAAIHQLTAYNNKIPGASRQVFGSYGMEETRGLDRTCTIRPNLDGKGDLIASGEHLVTAYHHLV